jgi:hypothetical protein
LPGTAAAAEARPLPRPADAAREADRALLRGRLGDVGLSPGTRVETQENRSVLLHVREGLIRLHRGFAYAPDRILRAIVAFTRAPSRPARRKAKRELVSFPVHDYVPARPRRARIARPRPGDREVVAQLRVLHAELNARHFGGRLAVPAFRLSNRMRSRLGEVVLPDDRRRRIAIVIGRRHLERDGWGEVGKTLLHEMVHQWQAEAGLPLDHGPAFRRMARALGVEPSARRAVPAPGGERTIRRTDAV